VFFFEFCDGTSRPFGAEGRKKSRPVRIKITGILWAADASIVAYFCHSHCHPRLRLGFDQERETEVRRARVAAGLMVGPSQVPIDVNIPVHETKFPCKRQSRPVSHGYADQGYWGTSTNQRTSPNQHFSHDLRSFHVGSGRRTVPMTSRGRVLRPRPMQCNATGVSDGSHERGIVQNRCRDGHLTIRIRI
jgi:hypothetical protein